MDRADLTGNERLDDLAYRGRFIIQRADMFRFGIDAVLLARFPSYRARDRVLDLGTGTGVIPLLMTDQVAHVAAVEIDDTLADMARRSVAMNGLTAKITVRQGDYRDMERLYDRGSFDFVLANPPYYAVGRGRENPFSALAMARHEITATLRQVTAAARYALRFRGRLAMVHLPERFDEVSAALDEAGMAIKRARFVEPRRGKPPCLLLVEAMAGGAPGAIRWLPTLTIYDAEGGYTPETLAIYGGAGTWTRNGTKQ